MYAVVIAQGSHQIVKVLSATAYKLYVSGIGKKEFEVDKDLMLYSSLGYKQCLAFILEKKNANIANPI